MAGTQDLSASLQEQVQQAHAGGTPLAIVGGGSKAFYGRPVAGTPLHVGGHRGVIHYEPSELVLTARAGTPLAEIESLLAENGQMLGFEPPHWGDGATLGGTVACNLSGPRRPYAGAVRDAVLGCRIINGRGEILRFGGEVMKNVAGYDAARLMAGALGTLGVLLDVSLKVLPLPAGELTLVEPCTLTEALARMNALAGRPLPISASAWVDGQLYLRLSGAAIDTLASGLPGDTLAYAESFWHCLRERRTPFFADAAPLWRIGLPQAAPQPELPGEWLIEWGGAQRWLKGEAVAAEVRAAVSALGGHATLMSTPDDAPVFHPLADGLWTLHRRLKAAFDPAGILNPGRMYRGL
jgi:glycolate oxidase FAD binding subunit